MFSAHYIREIVSNHVCNSCAQRLHENRDDIEILMVDDTVEDEEYELDSFFVEELSEDEIQAAREHDEEDEDESSKVTSSESDESSGEERKDVTPDSQGIKIPSSPEPGKPFITYFYKVTFEHFRKRLGYSCGSLNL